MFERYTEKARRVIFFARYEASQFGSPYIHSEHLLLGILREDKSLTNRFLQNNASVESIRHQIEGRIVVHEKISTSVDLPLADDCKRILAYAAEEAERLANQHIGTEHLLLGILRESSSFAAKLLEERGLQIAEVRQSLQTTPNTAASRPPGPVAVARPTPIPILFQSTDGKSLLPAGDTARTPIPRIGDSLTIAPSPEAPAQRFLVKDVTWTYLGTPPVALPEEIAAVQSRIDPGQPLQQIVITAEPV